MPIFDKFSSTHFVAARGRIVEAPVQLSANPYDDYVGKRRLLQFDVTMEGLKFIATLDDSISGNMISRTLAEKIRNMQHKSREEFYIPRPTPVTRYNYSRKPNLCTLNEGMKVDMYVSRVEVRGGQYRTVKTDAHVTEGVHVVDEWSDPQDLSLVFGESFLSRKKIEVHSAHQILRFNIGYGTFCTPCRWVIVHEQYPVVRNGRMVYDPLIRIFVGKEAADRPVVSSVYGSPVTKLADCDKSVEIRCDNQKEINRRRRKEAEETATRLALTSTVEEPVVPRVQSPPIEEVPLPTFPSVVIQEIVVPVVEEVERDSIQEEENFHDVQEE